MMMKKKILILSGLAFLIGIGIFGWLAYPFIAFFFYATESVSEDVPKTYMKETYGIDIKVIDKQSNALELGETRFVVTPKGKEDVKFTMVFSTTDDSLISEDYHFAVQAKEEIMELADEWPVIKELGFEPAAENGDEQTFFFHKDSIALSLVTKEKIEAPPLKDEDLERLYQLTMSVLSSGAVIDNIYIRNSNGGDSIEDFNISLSAMNQEITKEDFLIMLKRVHPEFAAYERQRE